MDLSGMQVHHGLATMAGLGSIGVALFDRFCRRELTAGEGKGRGGLGGSSRWRRGSGVGWATVDQGGGRSFLTGQHLDHREKKIGAGLDAV
jgi:hypothetical protein